MNAPTIFDDVPAPFPGYYGATPTRVETVALTEGRTLVLVKREAPNAFAVAVTDRDGRTIVDCHSTSLQWAINIVLARAGFNAADASTTSAYLRNRAEAAE